MSKKFRVIVGLLFFVPWVCFGVEWYFGRLAWVDDRSYIILTKPALSSSLVLAPLSSSLTLICLLIWSIIKRQKLVWKILLPVALLNIISYPIILFFGFITMSWGGWTMEDYTRGADGKIYYFLHEGTLGPGYSHALARREYSNPFWFKAKILGQMGEGGFGTFLIKPEPIKKYTFDDPYRIYSSPSGWIACFRGDECTVAYNIKMKHSFVYYNGLQTLSPFILIGPETRMHKPDVENLQYYAYPKADKDYDPELRRQHMVQAQKILQKELTNPNPEVRRIARDLLRRKQK